MVPTVIGVAKIKREVKRIFDNLPKLCVGYNFADVQVGVRRRGNSEGAV